MASQSMNLGVECVDLGMERLESAVPSHEQNLTVAKHEFDQDRESQTCNEYNKVKLQKEFVIRMQNKKEKKLNSSREPRIIKEKKRLGDIGRLTKYLSSGESIAERLEIIEETPGFLEIEEMSINFFSTGTSSVENSLTVIKQKTMNSTIRDNKMIQRPGKIKKNKRNQKRLSRKSQKKVTNQITEMTRTSYAEAIQRTEIAKMITNTALANLLDFAIMSGGRCVLQKINKKKRAKTNILPEPDFPAVGNLLTIEGEEMSQTNIVPEPDFPAVCNLGTIEGEDITQTNIEPDIPAVGNVLTIEEEINQTHIGPDPAFASLPVIEEVEIKKEIRARTKAWLSEVHPCFLVNTLSIEEEDALWNELQVAVEVNTSIQESFNRSKTGLKIISRYHIFCTFCRLHIYSRTEVDDRASQCVYHINSLRHMASSLTYPPTKGMLRFNPATNRVYCIICDVDVKRKSIKTVDIGSALTRHLRSREHTFNISNPWNWKIYTEIWDLATEFFYAQEPEYFKTRHTDLSHMQETKHNRTVLRCRICCDDLNISQKTQHSDCPKHVRKLRQLKEYTNRRIYPKFLEVYAGYRPTPDYFNIPAEVWVNDYIGCGIGDGFVPDPHPDLMLRTPHFDEVRIEYLPLFMDYLGPQHVFCMACGVHITNAVDYEDVATIYSAHFNSSGHLLLEKAYSKTRPVINVNGDAFCNVCAVPITKDPKHMMASMDTLTNMHVKFSKHGENISRLSEFLKVWLNKTLRYYHAGNDRRLKLDAQDVVSQTLKYLKKNKINTCIENQGLKEAESLLKGSSKCSPHQYKTPSYLETARDKSESVQILRKKFKNQPIDVINSFYAFCEQCDYHLARHKRTQIMTYYVWHLNSIGHQAKMKRVGAITDIMPGADTENGYCVACEVALEGVQCPRQNSLDGVIESHLLGHYLRLPS